MLRLASDIRPDGRTRFPSGIRFDLLFPLFPIQPSSLGVCSRARNNASELRGAVKFLARISQVPTLTQTDTTKLPHIGGIIRRCVGSRWCARVCKVEQRPESQSDQPAGSVLSGFVVLHRSGLHDDDDDDGHHHHHHQHRYCESMRLTTLILFWLPFTPFSRSRAATSRGARHAGDAGHPRFSRFASASPSYFVHRRSRRSSPRLASGARSRRRWRRHVLAACCISSSTARSHRPLSYNGRRV